MATTQTTELQLFKPEIGGEEDTWGQLLNTNMDEIDAHAASVNTTLGTLGTAATEADTKYAHRANNLSDLQSASAARTSLGLGTAATEADTKYNHRANNLSDVANQSTARGNLGLGTAAVQNDTRYNHRSNNLSDVANTTTARANLGAHNASNLTSGTLSDARLSANVAFQAQTLATLGGDFGSRQVLCTRSGNVITVQMTGAMTNLPSGKYMYSNGGAIPPTYRPPYTVRISWTTNEFLHYIAQLDENGSLTVTCRDPSSGFALKDFTFISSGLNLAFSRLP